LASQVKLINHVNHIKTGWPKGKEFGALLLSLIIPEGLKVLSPSDVSAGSGYI
jgi:hypothetical protein